MIGDVRRLRLLWGLGLAAIVCSGIACSSKGSNYIGRWECSAGGGDFFEIKANNDTFLVTNETGATYPAAIDDKGTLLVSGVAVMGSLLLVIDSDSDELICPPDCGCTRYKKVQWRR